MLFSAIKPPFITIVFGVHFVSTSHRFCFLPFFFFFLGGGGAGCERDLVCLQLGGDKDGNLMQFAGGALNAKIRANVSNTP